MRTALFSGILSLSLLATLPCRAVSFLGTSADQATAPLQVAQMGQSTVNAVQSEGTKAGFHAQAEASKLAQFGETLTKWGTTIATSLSDFSTAIDSLTAFGDPSKIASLIGLDGLLGDGTSGLGGLLKAGMSIGGTLMNTFDSVQNLASKGMALYSIGQSVAGGDYMGALSQAGFGDIANLAGMTGNISSMVSGEQTLSSFSGSVTGFRQLSTSADMAWNNVASATRQVQSASTDAEVQKAQANLAVQTAYAQDLTARQSSQQTLMGNLFLKQKAEERYKEQRVIQATGAQMHSLGGVTDDGAVERAYRSQYGVQR